jgi:hypothetical protein
MPASDALAAATTALGVVGLAWGIVRLAHADTASLVEIQHDVWEETRTQLTDCREALERERRA